MTTSAAPSLRRLTPQAAVLLLVAAVAWLVTVGRAGSMAGVTGTRSRGRTRLSTAIRLPKLRALLASTSVWLNRRE